MAYRAVHTGKIPLSEFDPEVKAIIKAEKERQVNGLELIAPEVTHTHTHTHVQNITNIIKKLVCFIHP